MIVTKFKTAETGCKKKSNSYRQLTVCTKNNQLLSHMLPEFIRYIRILFFKGISRVNWCVSCVRVNSCFRHQKNINSDFFLLLLRFIQFHKIEIQNHKNRKLEYIWDTQTGYLVINTAKSCKKKMNFIPLREKIVVLQPIGSCMETAFLSCVFFYCRGKVSGLCY